jgi:hypothetical protein
LRFKFHLIPIAESAFGRKAPKVGHVRLMITLLDCDDNEAAEPSVALVLAVIQYGSRAPPLIDRVVKPKVGIRRRIVFALPAVIYLVLTGANWEMKYEATHTFVI